MMALDVVNYWKRLPPIVRTKPDDAYRTFHRVDRYAAESYSDGSVTAAVYLSWRDEHFSYLLLTRPSERVEDWLTRWGLVLSTEANLPGLERLDITVVATFVKLADEEKSH